MTYFVSSIAEDSTRTTRDSTNILHVLITCKVLYIQNIENQCETSHYVYKINSEIQAYDLP